MKLLLKLWLRDQMSKVPFLPSRSIPWLTPADWLHITNLKTSLNSGDDVSGIIHELGSDVQKSGEFRVGDRVAAFHPMMAKGGAYAEYAVAPAHTVFKIPEGVGMEGTLHIFTIFDTAFPLFCLLVWVFEYLEFLDGCEEDDERMA